MTMESGHHLIEDYLDRLARAAHVLAPERRIDLMTQIRGHIEDARAAGGLESEADLRALLDRIGLPEEIVAAAADSEEHSGRVPGQPSGSQSWTPAYATASARLVAPRSMAQEIWAVVMLTGGSIAFPVVGWLVGVALLWSSDRWRTREKVLGTLVVPGGIGIFAVFLLMLPALALFAVEPCFRSATVEEGGDAGAVTIGMCSDSGPGMWTVVAVLAVLAILALASLAVPFFLLHLARRRASVELATPVQTWAGQPVG